MVSGSSSSDSKHRPPSFFKVVRYPSASHLALPTAFVRRYLKKIPKNPILRTATGEHSWRLKIKKIGDNYCFDHGWDQLVKDTQLSVKDILVFWLIDQVTFEVSFFNEHGCEKDLPSKSNNTSDTDADDVDAVKPDENLCFQRVISSKTHKYGLSLPKKFVVAAGLEYTKSIKMIDYNGKGWIIGLLAERYERTKYSLTSRWSAFRQYHELSDGDICTFKFIKEEGVMILTQVIRSKKSHKQEVTPPLKKASGGGDVKVKIEDEAGVEAEVVKRKKVVEKNSGGVKVKIEDETCVETVKRPRPVPPLVEVKREEETSEVVKRKETRLETEEDVIISKHVVYF